MLGVFILALVLWATSQFTKIDATTVAFLGISILLATSVLVWDDVKSEKGAWDTLVWMGTSMGFAGFLVQIGLHQMGNSTCRRLYSRRILDYCLRYSCTY